MREPLIYIDPQKARDLDWDLTLRAIFSHIHSKKIFYQDRLSGYIIRISCLPRIDRSREDKFTRQYHELRHIWQISYSDIMCTLLFVISITFASINK